MSMHRRIEKRIQSLGLVLPYIDAPQPRGRDWRGEVQGYGGPPAAAQEPSAAHATAGFRYAPYSVNAVRTGSLLYLSGKGPAQPDGLPVSGKVGEEFSVAQAYLHAHNIALTHLAVLRQELGSLARVKQVVKVLGMVNAAPGFTAHSEVVNGWSDVFVNVFGDAGRHARSAVGMASLPRGISVEIEAIVEIRRRTPLDMLARRG